jgi:hypothetical protein
MLRIIFAGLADEILKDMIRIHEKETLRNPFLQPIEAEIERLEDMEEQINARLEALKSLHHFISGIFDPQKTDKPDSPTKPEAAKTPPAGSAQPEPAPEPQAGSEPTPKRGRKTKEKAKPEYKRLPKHRATGNPRLDALETALHDALECLNNTKLAFYVKDIKEVRIALDKLYKSWDKPEDERTIELETGLKAAADKLSGNSRAAKSKIMQDVWSNIIVTLQNKENNE